MIIIDENITIKELLQRNLENLNCYNYNQTFTN